VRPILAALCALLLIPAVARPDVVGVVPKKLIVLDRMAASGRAKALFIAKDAGADSCVHFRTNERGSDGMPNPNQMPPLASDVVDATGLATIASWIAELPPPAP